MFVAHIFGGYIGTRQCLRTLASDAVESGKTKYYLIFGLICSVLPDFDLLYFYGLDHRQHPHHTYWTHMPFFWISVTLLVYLFGRFVLKKNLTLACVILMLGTFLHLVLDSVAGGIYWLYPFSDVYFRVFLITSRFDWWVLNYILHWTFLFEILIIGGSVFLMRKDYLHAVKTSYAKERPYL